MMLRVGYRYTSNLISMVARQQGYLAAAKIGTRFIATEVAKFPWAIALAARHRSTDAAHADAGGNSGDDTLTRELADIGLRALEYRIDLNAFRDHINGFPYPLNYAAGTMNEGGAREEKLLEYFVSVDLLQVRPTDVVIDIASEWSIFPEMLRKHTGATVYQQDLIYQPGINSGRIGGSAAHMPVRDGFADKLVLHNAFEHFEGTADSDFIKETRRVLKPGGVLCILPLFVAEEYTILTDPLVNRRGIIWDEGARIIEQAWFHNRFARFYDPAALQRRVLAYAQDLSPTLHKVVNSRQVHPRAYLTYVLMLRAPAEVTSEAS